MKISLFRNSNLKAIEILINGKNPEWNYFSWTICLERLLRCWIHIFDKIFYEIFSHFCIFFWRFSFSIQLSKIENSFLLRTLPQIFELGLIAVQIGLALLHQCKSCCLFCLVSVKEITKLACHLFELSSKNNDDCMVCSAKISLVRHPWLYYSESISRIMLKQFVLLQLA